MKVSSFFREILGKKLSFVDQIQREIGIKYAGEMVTKLAEVHDEEKKTNLEKTLQQDHNDKIAKEYKDLQSNKEKEIQENYACKTKNLQEGSKAKVFYNNQCLDAIDALKQPSDKTFWDYLSYAKDNILSSAGHFSEMAKHCTSSSYDAIAGSLKSVKEGVTSFKDVSGTLMCASAFVGMSSNSVLHSVSSAMSNVLFVHPTLCLGVTVAASVAINPEPAFKVVKAAYNASSEGFKTVYDTTKAVANCMGAGVAVLTAGIEYAENLFETGNNTEANQIIL